MQTPRAAPLQAAEDNLDGHCTAQQDAANFLLAEVAARNDGMQAAAAQALEDDERLQELWQQNPLLADEVLVLMSWTLRLLSRRMAAPACIQASGKRCKCTAQSLHESWWRTEGLVMNSSGIVSADGRKVY